MVKDYFQDIIPPSSDEHRTRSSHAHTLAHSRATSHARSVSRTPRKDTDIPAYNDDDPIEQDVDMAQEAPAEAEVADVGLRSIRNINIPSRTRPRMESDISRMGSETMYPTSSRPNSRGSRLWIWAIALICVATLALIGLIATRSTVVTIVPNSHAIIFDQTSQFVAYPATVAASGTLPYTVQTAVIDDSQIIAAKSGTSHVETMSSGTITVYNNYSPTPVRLVAKTRFEAPGGLIYRTPNAIVIPGKTNNAPASVNVTVIAESAGQQYNIAAGTRLTLPGLKSNAMMYNGIYAETNRPMSGGFLGETAATDPTERAQAIASIRTRLQEKAIQSITDKIGSNSTFFPDLMRITYEDMPDTTESNGIGIHERIHVSAPIFPSDTLAHMVGASVAADAESSNLKLVGGEGYTATSMETTATTTILGSTPIHFTLAGAATLVWEVDQTALAKALAGRDQTAFKTIIAHFPGIKEARARIEPFWKGTFPTNPDDIKFIIRAPQPIK
jgi:hypothetical protein